MILLNFLGQPPGHLCRGYSYEHTDCPAHRMIQIPRNYAYQHYDITTWTVVREETKGNQSVSLQNCIGILFFYLPLEEKSVTIKSPLIPSL